MIKKFYILFKNTSTLEGTISCSKEEFEQLIINPLKSTIHTWDVWDSLLLKELDSELINQTI